MNSKGNGFEAFGAFLDLTTIDNGRGLDDRTLVLWDSEAQPGDGAWLLYRWSGYEEHGSVRSLLRYVETRGERLREKYLSWIHELGETRIKGKRVIDHLAIEPGLSYWWMTLFVEQSPWKSPSITDVIRLFALEEIVADELPRRLRLVSQNRQLHRVLGALCKNLGLDYEWERPPKIVSREPILRRLYKSLPHRIRALITLVRYVRLRWPLRRAEASGWFAGDGSLFLCSYFLHIDPRSCDSGGFHSHQWEALPGLLRDSGIQTNWIHHYLQSAVAPDPDAALRLIRFFNECSEGESFHTFLDAHLSWRIVLRVLKGWARLNTITFPRREFERAFRPRNSDIFLWPIIEDEWYASMRGSVAVGNLMWLELFDVALRKIPHQERGLYLCENQSWERALVHAWRKYKHGELIAVVHSTVRFWDLRYFTDRRTLRLLEPLSMPLADRVALNGPAAVEAYRNTGYTEDLIVECEALRYGYLADSLNLRAPTKTTQNPTRVLILGDFDKSDTIRMLKLLERAVPKLTARMTYTLKPHPNYSPESADYKALELRIVLDPLPKIMQDFDIAYAGNTTSAAVDAYLAGLPVVVMLGETGLNYSPLRGKKGVHFVGTPGELAKALQETRETDAHNAPRNEFFFLDPKLPRWKSLLFADIDD
ncbi:MAG: hypothetical protein M3Z54_12750 [Gemmatimonadota bacterium]|nr:hypothetical protein [Gemmatimonadota bacterium]